jgi:choice-of-anchor C domain-containing protein
VGCSSRWSATVLISSVSFFLAVGLAQTELMNGSFENGTNPGEAMVLPPGSTAIDGWTVVGGNVSYVGGRWQHSQGFRSVGLPCGGGISQTFETEPNQEYEVRFNMAGDPNALPAVKSLEVSFGGVKRVFTFDTTGRSLGNMGWESRTWVFATADPTVTLTFSSPTTECSTPAVDNVRTTANEIGVQIHPDATISASRRGAGLRGEPLRQ